MRLVIIFAEFLVINIELMIFFKEIIDNYNDLNELSPLLTIKISL